MGSTIDAWLHNVGACRLSVGGMRPKQAGVVLGLRVLGLRVLGLRVFPSVGGELHQHDVAPPSIKWLGGGASW